MSIIKTPYTCVAIDESLTVLEELKVWLNRVRRENGDLRAEAKAHALENKRLKARIAELTECDG